MISKLVILICYVIQTVSHGGPEGTTQGGGSVSRVNIGRLITTSLTSRHTSMIFKMGNFFVCYFLQKMIIFRRSGNFFCLARMAKHLKNRKE